MIGKTISHYKILEKLGEGGMGVVYKAEDTKLQRHVALKFLPQEWTRDPDAKARFMNEARAASALEHNNICNIHEIDETEDGQLFISMAFYEGETIREKIDRGPLKLKEAVNLANQIAEGLENAHEKTIVHQHGPQTVKRLYSVLTGVALAHSGEFQLVERSQNR